ncbi:hypothetical protein ASJ30_06460 [Janibacter indicus]|uniref:Nucleotidyl transferase AbiEii toxin, Type IV TA system n=1 Tax=Janibacter indicus TaxID=857417 RepID=A0A1L3MFU5_9MICO|nr:hypothetical protein [Janibacter indicus]APH01231.1 hypothetical protein ASJ30_06460 [Janibacter indicus]
MTALVVAPTLLRAHEQSWHALLELARRVPGGWTVIGGQMIHLHVWERGGITARPTDDGDAGLDVRADPGVARRVTGALADMGFSPRTTSPDGPQVRWTRGEATVDVLVPAATGAERLDVAGRPILASHGVQQALDRTTTVTLRVGTVEGAVPRPRLVGCLVSKAAALANDDPRPARHLHDLAVLLHLLRSRDLDLDPLTPRDVHHLHPALRRLDDPFSGVSLTPDARVAIAVLRQAAPGP